MRGTPGRLADVLAYRASLLLLVLRGVFLEAARQAVFRVTKGPIPANSRLP